jgi:hypothetical protein
MVKHAIGNLILILLVCVLLFIGYLIGDLLGTHMTQALVTHEKPYLLLLYRPAHEYIFLYDKLNDTNELNRLSGYYSLLEYKKIDNKFLMDRYRREKSLYIKRSIIWILGFSEDRSGAIDFFSSIYKSAPLEIQLEILRSIKRMDRSVLNQFIDNQKESKDLLKKVQ